MRLAKCCILNNFMVVYICYQTQIDTEIALKAIPIVPCVGGSMQTIGVLLYLLEFDSLRAVHSGRTSRRLNFLSRFYL